MNIGITGANGLFGKGLVRVAEKRHHVFPLTRTEADLRDPQQVNRAIRPLRLDILIHAAANPSPDWCETHPEEAFDANVGATANLVGAAREFGFTLVFISTDAVFDGKNAAPYTELDTANPLSIYGRTKLRSEELVRELDAHWIFRVGVLFGPGKLNFVDKGLDSILRGESYEVASDQVGSALYTLDAAEKILEVVEARHYGLYHLANQGGVSRFELAQSAAEIARLDASKIVGRPLAEMNRPGPRPAHAELAMTRLSSEGFALPRNWRDALAAYIREFVSTADASLP